MALRNLKQIYPDIVYICVGYGDEEENIKNLVKELDLEGQVMFKADEENNLVQYHSDIRSDKIVKLKANQNAAMLFYDKEEKIQVRLKVECIVNHENEITKESWSKTQHIYVY